MGSSSSRMSGFCSSSRHRATRRRSPPDSTAMDGVRIRAAQGVHGLLQLGVQVPAVEGVDLVLQRALAFASSASMSAPGSANFSLISLYSRSSATLAAAPSSTTSRTVLVSSSTGSCSSRPGGVALGQHRLAVEVLVHPGHDPQHRGSCPSRSGRARRSWRRGNRTARCP